MLITTFVIRFRHEHHGLHELPVSPGASTTPDFGEVSSPEVFGSVEISDWCVLGESDSTHCGALDTVEAVVLES